LEVVPVPKAQRENLLHNYLMYESLDAPSTSKGQKLAKKYLKVDRMDLELWNAYAQAEKMLGRFTEVRLWWQCAHVFDDRQLQRDSSP
jgi:hypothetical protein